MLSLPEKKKPLNVLCLGAHCDDIEIGCGATLLKLAEDRPSLSVTWVVFSFNELRAAEAKASAARFLAGNVTSDVRLHDFRNGYFPYIGTEIKDQFEALKKEVDPDVIFTHYKNDLHQDHRVIGELTWNTFRDHLIMEYEIPKYDGGLGSPNAFVSIPEFFVNQKLDILLECFPSQLNRGWFERSTFEGLMRLRGVECNAHSGYAEAFYSRKAEIFS